MEQWPLTPDIWKMSIESRRKSKKDEYSMIISRAPMDNSTVCIEGITLAK